MTSVGNRKSTLEEILLKSLLKTEMSDFYNYLITDDDLSLIQKACSTILGKIPQNAFNCATLSALLGAMMQDNSNIPAVVVAGHLDINSKRIFFCKNIIPYTNEKKIINEIWDGHCWVEINNTIIDISLLRTIHFGNVPDFLRSKIINDFGFSTGALIASPEKFAENGFIYTPCYVLSQNQINGLILGAQEEFTIE